MDKNKKATRYERVFEQIQTLTKDINNPVSRMSTISAILHHKFNYYFWTGFYLLNEKQELLVGPYQGPLACLKLKAHTGVCWAGIDQAKAIIVDDVETFPGHIACSSKSKSEIVVPLYTKENKIIGILDVDSEAKNSFDETDQHWLNKICQNIYE